MLSMTSSECQPEKLNSAAVAITTAVHVSGLQIDRKRKYVAVTHGFPDHDKKAKAANITTHRYRNNLVSKLVASE